MNNTKNCGILKITSNEYNSVLNATVTIKIEPEDDQQVEVYFNMIQQ